MSFPSVDDPTHAYFITATITGWRPILNSPPYVDIILGSLDWLRKAGRVRLFGFVVMPSHTHLLLRTVGRPIEELVRDFGSFTAHEILQAIRRQGDDELLAYLSRSARDTRHRHSIWRKIQAKNVFSRRFALQKLEYIHNNPLKATPPLVCNRADYRYSSACFYDRGSVPVIGIDDLAALF